MKLSEGLSAEARITLEEIAYHAPYTGELDESIVAELVVADVAERRWEGVSGFLGLSKLHITPAGRKALEE